MWQFWYCKLLSRVVGAITGTSVGGSLFKVAAFIFLIVSMVRVGKGKPHHISALTEPAQWFNDHIELEEILGGLGHLALRCSEPRRRLPKQLVESSN